MNNAKKYLLGLLALITVFSTAIPAGAADLNTASGQAPIVFEGDDLSFSELTGEVFAKGNVRIQKDQMVITTEELRGNTRQSQVWVDGLAQVAEPGLNLAVNGVDYNYRDRTGTMAGVRGTIDKENISAQNIQLAPDEYILYNGTITRCPAKVPDYHVSADKIEVWPGNRIVAYNARFWIKDKVIFVLPKYQKSLNAEAVSESSFPRLGYDSDNGVMIAQYLEFPFNDHLAVYGDAAYYSRSHFKPKAGLINREKNYTASIDWGYAENSDNDWVKKEPEFAFKLNPYRLGHSPVTANFSASAGKWIEGDISGWRQDYNLYFGHDPIKLSDVYTLKVGAGFEKIKYGYDKSTNDIWKYDIKLNAKPNDRLEWWTGYSYRDQSGTNVYKYDEIDTPKEWTTGFMYKADKLNSLGVEVSYDVEQSKVEDIDYTWRRNLHCFKADIIYRAERDQVKVRVSTLEW